MARVIEKPIIRAIVEHHIPISGFYACEKMIILSQGGCLPE